VKPLKLKRVQGLLTDDTKNPVQNAALTLRRIGKDLEVVAQAKSDSRGRFQFTQVGYGKYYLYAEAPGFATYAGEIHVSRWRSVETGIILVMEMGVTTGCEPGYARTARMPD